MSPAGASSVKGPSTNASQKKKPEDSSKKAVAKTAPSAGQRKLGSFFAPAGQKTIGSFFAPAKEQKPKDVVEKDASNNDNLESTPAKPQKEKRDASVLESGGEKAQKAADDECVMVLSDSEGKDEAQATPPTAKKADAIATERRPSTQKGAEEDGAAAQSAITVADDLGAISASPKEKGKVKTPNKSADIAKAAESKPSEAKAKAKSAPARKDEGTGAGARQGTLDFSKCPTKDKKAIFKKKERPPHPAGSALGLTDRHMMVLQFSSTFQRTLKLPALSAEALGRGLTSKEDEDVLATLHTALLRIIVRDGETPDEERLLDENSWPEVLRQHLQDVHGQEHEAIWRRLEKEEYVELGGEARLTALTVLVDDCIASKTVRQTVDGSLEHLEELRKQQMLDEIQEKCRKVESSEHRVVQGGELDVFVEEVAPSGEEGGEGGAMMTERQRTLQKQREEEARAARIAEEKRQREEKRVAEEESRRKEQQLRAKREEARAAQLIEHGSVVRVPWLGTTNVNYWVVDCIGGSRRLVCEQYGHEQAERNTWSMHTTPSQYVELHDYWNPLKVESDQKQFLKKLREFMPPAIKADASEPEIMDVDESAAAEAKAAEVAKSEEEKNGEEEMEVEKAASQKEEEEGGAAPEKEHGEEKPTRVHGGLLRAREVVLCLDDCTPDDMFADFKAYCEERDGWRVVVEVAEGLEALKGQVEVFEGYLKRAKMQEGWDEVRPKWLQDLAAAATVAGLAYLVKQLRVYVGKQRPNPAKLASIFAGPMRMTRMRARAAAGEQPKRKRLADESSAEEEEGESSGGEVESAGEEWVEEKEEEQEEEQERRGTRTRGGGSSLRPRKALKKVERGGAEGGRALRSSSRLAVRGGRSLKEESEEEEEESDDSCEVQTRRRSERASKRRERIEEEEEEEEESGGDDSDHSGPATRR